MRSRIDNGQENLFVRILPTPPPTIPDNITPHQRAEVNHTTDTTGTPARPASCLSPHSSTPLSAGLLYQNPSQLEATTKAQAIPMTKNTDTEFTAVASACRNPFNQPTEIIYSLKSPSRNTLQTQLFKLKWSFVHFKLTFVYLANAAVSFKCGLVDSWHD